MRLMVLEDFFFSDFAKSSAAKLYGWTNNFFWLLFHGLSLYRFSTDSFWKQSSFYANRIRAVCNVACVFSPSAPYSIATIDDGIFSTFKGLTCGRTSFLLSQYLHNLLVFY
jgi:hypothetical protein